MCVQVRIVAGRPMHCQVPGIEYTMGKRAVQTMLEGATAISLSYSGVLYIAETDEKKIHRIRQVSFSLECSSMSGSEVKIWILDDNTVHHQISIYVFILLYSCL